MLNFLQFRFNKKATKFVEIFADFLENLNWYVKILACESDSLLTYTRDRNVCPG